MVLTDEFGSEQPEFGAEFVEEGAGEISAVDEAAALEAIRQRILLLIEGHGCEP